jgi:hypothetical protein
MHTSKGDQTNSNRTTKSSLMTPSKVHTSDGTISTASSSASQQSTANTSTSSTTTDVSDSGLLSRSMSSLASAERHSEDANRYIKLHGPDLLRIASSEHEDCTQVIADSKRQIRDIENTIIATTFEQARLSNYRRTVRGILTVPSLTKDSFIDQDRATVEYLNQVTCDSMLTFMGTFITSNLIGDAPLDIIRSGSCGSTDIKAKICFYFVQNYLRYVDINDKGDITVKARYSVHVDSRGRVKLRDGCTPLTFLVERFRIQDTIQDMWDHYSKRYEDLCSNHDKWGTYQTPTSGSFIKVWLGLLEHEWVQELGDKRLNVADVGSGMNAFCTIGSLLIDRIGVAVGLEASEHRCYLAATNALGLCTMGFAFNALFGFLMQDFESPTVSVCGADILFFWDRAYSKAVSKE